MNSLKGATTMCQMTIGIMTICQMIIGQMTIGLMANNSTTNAKCLWQ